MTISEHEMHFIVTGVDIIIIIVASLVLRIKYKIFYKNNVILCFVQSS